MLEEEKNRGMMASLMDTLPWEAPKDTIVQQFSNDKYRKRQGGEDSTSNIFSGRPLRLP